MAEDMIQASKSAPTQKRQPYNWVPNIKISELLDFTVTKRSSSSSPGSGKRSEQVNSSCNDSEHSRQLLLRGSPVVTPWSQHYKGLHVKPPTTRIKHVSNLRDVEKKLAGLSLKHSDDEIYRRHFTEDNESTDDGGVIPDDASSSVTVVQENVALPAVRKPIRKAVSIYRPPRQVKYPSKSSKRHRFCLSKYPHSRKNQKRYYVKEADEIQHEVTVDQKGLKEAWEFYVLGKLSDETQCFINHRFDGKEKPKEKLIDFLDAGYRDKDRTDYMMKRKRRLFDMPYKHDEFPGASTHL